MTETFESLHARLHRHVYRRALSIVHDPTDADDVAQLTWMKVARALNQFRGEMSTPATWVYAITTNCARDWRRHQRRRKADCRLTVEILAALEIPDRAPSPLVGLLSKERQAQICASIVALPSDERSVLTAYWRAEDYAEAARQLAIPLGTLKSRLFRARVRIRKERVACPTPRRRHAAPSEASGATCASSSTTTACTGAR